MQRDRAEVDEIDECLDVVRDEVLDVALRVLAPDRDRLDPVGHETWRILLIEGFPVDAVGKARQHHGAVFEIRQQPGRDGSVILDEIALGVLLFRPEDLVEIRELHFTEHGARSSTLRCLGRFRFVLLRAPCSVLAWHHHILRLLIITEPDKHRLSQQAVFRHLLIPHIAHQLRLDPDVIGAFGQRTMLRWLTGRRVAHERLQLGADLVELVARKSRTGPAAINELAVFVCADVQ